VVCGDLLPKPSGLVVVCEPIAIYIAVVISVRDEWFGSSEISLVGSCCDSSTLLVLLMSCQEVGVISDLVATHLSWLSLGGMF